MPLGHLSPLVLLLRLGLSPFFLFFSLFLLNIPRRLFVGLDLYIGSNVSLSTFIHFS